MLSTIVICIVALAASGLTFFSGFGLGTLLLPAFAFFYPIEQAVALTAIVHFLNSLFKVVLIGRHADRHIAVAFGLPAIAASLFGALLLVHLARIPPLASYTVGHVNGVIEPAKLVVGLLLLTVTAIEALPRFQSVAVPPEYMPLGGLLSGFFGGISGMQGALRSAFLIRAGLTKEAFIATGVVIAALVDVTRLSVYSRNIASQIDRLDYGLLAAAVISAFAGALLGNRFLKRITVQAVQRIVALMLTLAALGLISGIL